MIPHVSVWVSRISWTSVESFLRSREHLVEVVLSQHGAHGGLGQHVGRGHVVLDHNDRPLRIDDLEIEDRVNLHRDVVARDHVLARHLDDLDAEVDPDHLLRERDQQDQARASHCLEAAERENHRALILAEDLDARCEHESGEKHDEENDGKS